MFSEINNFIIKCIKKKEIKFIDLYFSKIFDNNSFESDIIMLFAVLVSLSSRNGNVCLILSKIFSKDIFSNYILNFLEYFFIKYLSLSDCINILFKFNVLSKNYYIKSTPLIFYNNCIYLYKFWIYEEYVVNFINLNFSIKSNNFINKSILLKYLDKFNLDIYQKISIIGIILNKFTIISGGPGTGKTTLISLLIFVLYKIYKFKHSNCIKIISFTGKSSSNITFSLRKNYNYLNINSTFKKILPKKAITIHKFLGFNYNKNIINNSINTDILIIDEASMIDISLAFYLFNSIKYIKKIVFLGDSNQIGSIEPGSFFNIICNLYSKQKYYKSEILKKMFWNVLNIKKKNNTYISYINNIFFLKKNYRFKKNIYLYKFINLIKLGYIKYIDNFLYENNFKNNFNFYDSNKYNFNFLLDICVKNYMNYINFINSNFNFKKIWKVFNKFQIICVIKKTYLGINFLNKYINNFFLKNNLVKNIVYFSNLNCYHYMGEPLVITKNNNDLKLYNGDVGFFIFLKKKFKLLFLDVNKNNRFIYCINLTNWNNIWAVTVHKSQGSEFKHILLIIPNYFSTLLSREIIYTAITRAKKKVTIYADKNIFLSSIKKKKKTFSNIANKLLI